MIEIKDFSFRYREGSEEVLKHINLTIPEGSFVGITGAAGSGKSTLTYALNGVIPHCYPGDFYGSVLVCGHDTCECELTEISRCVGSVCQDIDSQMVSGVVEDEMLFGLENFGVPKEEIEARANEAYRILGIENLRECNIDALSGGQKQKLAIACILALRPRVLVLDEPTSELDPTSTITVFDTLARYAKESGITVVVVEQKIAMMSAYADMLVVMQDGCVRYAAPPCEVLAHADDLREIGVNAPRATTLMERLKSAGAYTGPVCKNIDDAAHVLEAQLKRLDAGMGEGAIAGAGEGEDVFVGAGVDAFVGAGVGEGVDKHAAPVLVSASVSAMPVSAEVIAPATPTLALSTLNPISAPTPIPTKTTPAIEFRAVNAAYATQRPILHEVSFAIEKGEFVAFVGTNGAGKSTAMRLVNGLLKPTSGQVLIDGVSTTDLKTSDLAKKIGFLFQNPDRQICCNTVRDELLFNFRATGRFDDEACKRVDAVIKEFGFEADADPFLLNRGTRQLLALASAIVTSPEVVVLDEPTSGLDYLECLKVMTAIETLQQKGTTVVMVCHDMEVVADFASRVIVINAGCVVADGPTFDILRSRDICERASLVPPQMVELSSRLACALPTLENTPVAHANTLDEMTEALLSVLFYGANAPVFTPVGEARSAEEAHYVREMQSVREAHYAREMQFVREAQSVRGMQSIEEAQSVSGMQSIEKGGQQ